MTKHNLAKRKLLESDRSHFNQEKKHNDKLNKNTEIKNELIKIIILLLLPCSIRKERKCISQL